MARMPHDVVDLRLHVDQGRVVARSGIGAEGHEQIGIAGDIDTLVRLRAARPLAIELTPVQAGDGKGRARLGHLEAGGENDAVDPVLQSLRSADALLRQLGDGPGDQLAVILLQRAVIVARHQHALAADAEVRLQLPLHPGRRALEHLEAIDLLHQFGDDLHRAGEAVRRCRPLRSREAGSPLPAPCLIQWLAARPRRQPCVGRA